MYPTLRAMLQVIPCHLCPSGVRRIVIAICAVMLNIGLKTVSGTDHIDKNERMNCKMQRSLRMGIR